jgi:homoserine dehydrogenase
MSPCPRCGPCTTAIAHGIKPVEPLDRPDLGLARLDEVHRSFYIRLCVKDRPGVLAEVASILAAQNISIESLLQRPNGGHGQAHLILTTHVCSEAAMALAVKALKLHPSLLKKPFLLRIADFAQRLG